MKPDWDAVKKLTLWSYEDLIRKLLEVLAYGFVQEHYNHSMGQAQAYAESIRGGYLQNQGDMAGYINNIVAYLQQLERLGVGTYADLIQQVKTREACQDFLQQTALEFESLIQVLNYLFRWVFPFKTPLREFIDTDDPEQLKYLGALKAHKIGSNLDLLEAGRIAAGRIQLASATEIPLSFITALVHKADISRLAYVRGKTVQHLCGGAYNTLDKIANANMEEMEEKMDAYYRTLGKSLANFKSSIILSWMVGGAQILPRVVQE
jgi:hypothetical protein